MLQSPRLRCCSGNPDGIATGLPTRCTNFPDLVLAPQAALGFMVASSCEGGLTWALQVSVAVSFASPAVMEISPPVPPAEDKPSPAVTSMLPPAALSPDVSPADI